MLEAVLIFGVTVLTWLGLFALAVWYLRGDL